MKWSTQITYGKLFAATLGSLPPVLVSFYVVWITLVVAVSGDVKSIWSWVIGILFGAVGVPVFAALLAVWQLRRMRRLAETTVIHYELTDKLLRLKIGKDTVSLPRYELRIRRQGKEYLALMRKRTWAGSIALIFDDSETLERAKVLLVG